MAGPATAQGLRPEIDNDDEQTPIQRGIVEAIKGRARGEAKPKCTQAIDEGNQDDIAKFCKVKKLKTKKFDQSECPDCGDILNPAGKRIGKKIRTETELEFADADQRHPGQLKWDNVVFSENGVAQMSSAILGQAGGDSSGRGSAVLFPDAAVNDDKDCVDTVTEVRYGGLVAGTSSPVPDGDPASCFDAGGTLKATLTEVFGGCEHLDGQFFPGDPSDGVEDDCYDEDGVLKTTLDELIDEDGPESADNDGDGLENEDPPGDIDGDGNDNDDFDCVDLDGTILRDAECFDSTGALFADLAALVDEDGTDQQDNDRDGEFDEDPPALDMDEACRGFGRQLGFPESELDALLVDGECDLTRAIKVAANNASMAAFGKKIYKANDKGEDDPEETQGVPFGEEERRVKIIESFTVMCEEGAELDEETGQCLVPATEQLAAAQFAGSPAPLAATLSCTDDGTTRTCKKPVMMGFTLAPPAIEWGYEVREEGCVLGVCVELFFAKIGYDFEVALGLRLPAEVRVSGVPKRSTPPKAEESVSLQTTLQPLDFTVQDYKDFCREHNLSALPTIASCDRFAFPSLIERFDPSSRPDSEIDGDEFVAQGKVFAGVIVRTMGVPLINWSIGIPETIDLAGICTLYLIKERQTQDELGAIDSILSAGSFKDLKNALKGAIASCSSFETPFGVNKDAIPIPRLRAFPFPPRLEIRADCAEAVVRGEVITIGGKVYPRCTDLILGIKGASLGIGVGIEMEAGSKLIEAQTSAGGDANPAWGETVSYRHAAEEAEPPITLSPLLVDNYDDRDFRDNALVTMRDFTYYLNTLQFNLFAKLQFGGVLSPIPDLPRLRLLSVTVSTGQFGIPIGQHAGTEDLTVPFFVENYGLEADVSPRPLDPKWVDAKTLSIKPGEFGEYLISARNIGSVKGGFDDFEVSLSNRRQETAPFTFFIDPNTDYDCEDAAGSPFSGDPTDGTADGCYDVAGNLRPDRLARIDEDPVGPDGELREVRDEDGDGLADEDPVEDWRTEPDAPTLFTQTIDDVNPYARSQDSGKVVLLQVSPFRHPLTSPGVYPFRITTDSAEAKTFGLAAVDPSGNRRIDATDVAFIQVEAFYDPQIAIQPTDPSGKPGAPHLYTVEITNMANVDDLILFAIEFLDYNQAGCGLATMGKDPGCPYRAVPTVIQAPPGATALDDWTTVSGLPSSVGPYAPLFGEANSFSIQAPRDWAGMEDTTYQYRATTTSDNDPDSPPASNSRVIDLTVIATKESMTRYIELEIRELISEIEAANARGIRTAGLLPLTMQAALRQNLRALASILAGRFSNATHTLEATGRIMEGFLRQLASQQSKLPINEGLDWQIRAEAIVEDLAVAAASQVTSLPIP